MRYTSFLFKLDGSVTLYDIDTAKPNEARQVDDLRKVKAEAKTLKIAKQRLSECKKAHRMYWSCVSVSKVPTVYQTSCSLCGTQHQTTSPTGPF